LDYTSWIGNRTAYENPLVELGAIFFDRLDFVSCERRDVDGIQIFLDPIFFRGGAV